MFMMTDKQKSRSRSTPNRKQRRRMERAKKKQNKKPQLEISKSPPKPETKEQIIEIIRRLEYQRIQLPNFPNVRFIMQQDSLTKAIQIYYKKLAKLEGKKEK